jgi:hypothetical protein
MAGKKSGSNRGLYFGQYNGKGAIPTNPVAMFLRNTSDSIEGKTEVIKSGELLPGRSTSAPVKGNSSSGGGVPIEFSALSFDRLLAGLFMANWVRDVSDPKVSTLVPGSLGKRFWILKHFAEPDRPIFQLFEKCAVDSLELTFTINDIVKGNFGFVGSNDPLMVPTTNPVTGLSVLPAALETEAFTSRIGYLNIDGIENTETKDIKISIKNNYAALYALFQAGADLKEKKLDVGGSVTIYFSDEETYNKAVNGDTVTFAVQVADAAGNSYLFELSGTKFDSHSSAVSGADEIAPSFPFTAFGTNVIKVTRTLATAPTLFSLTYDDNDATSGTVPAAVTLQEAGAMLFAAANSGTLAKTGSTFDGWNTAADGSGTDYAAGEPIVIEEDTTLYAVWS